jgi:FlaA1/EpsC-like NDP-sugar epimerase
VNILDLIGREKPLFSEDIDRLDEELREIVNASSFLVIGGAGSIGQAVTREIFKRQPKKLHVVDISENNMVELVRELRSSIGYIGGDFKTFAIDCGGTEFEALIKSGNGYDYVLNLSALKHVRSEKDPFTLMRLIDVNIFKTIKTLNMARAFGARKYFCVSTDKAANPVNMMGGSKRIMELFLMRESESMNISMARFANVAFSDGSLLHGFNQRFAKQQPISAPTDVLRYFLTPQESGELCLLSCLFGNNRDIFFPKLSEDLDLSSFSVIAQKYIRQLGFTPHICESEDDARENAQQLISNKEWPCYFFESNTTGEKGYEEFYTGDEALDLNRFSGIGVISNALSYSDSLLDNFSRAIRDFAESGKYDKSDIVREFQRVLPNFAHIETGRYLDGRM